ncbi:SDR family oxidoreductase [Aquibacillus koreensis]|uniref:SDR family oxidoreductase n=1 Tax=Aquibacillus koreensis TaxID=279446 RepID=A0A9X3WQL0_9BACI|nr:SDR family oxidoreductase [Aquibacillus koreensis]MCT2534590.1 SDR family oxidoreductase [Aquibacillus koreensis]MDC3421816.1 SDR family oxidoreductase [Aquibacillus koreensis]
MNKNCLIVGASGEIGMEIARRVASEGYRLLLHYNQNKDSLEGLYQELEPESVLDVIHGDLSNSTGIHSFLEKIHFPVQSIIFASGKSHHGLFQDTSEEKMDEMIHIHVKAPWMITKALIPDMVRNHTGHIILISSIWGDVGASCEVIYSSVKGAQNSFVKALARELGQSSISVNGVSPGFIDTKMNFSFSEMEKQEIIEQIPLNRAGKPSDVAQAVSFLLDERSSYIQGEIINVTGAW